MRPSHSRSPISFLDNLIASARPSRLPITLLSVPASTTPRRHSFQLRGRTTSHFLEKMACMIVHETANTNQWLFGLDWLRVRVKVTAVLLVLYTVNLNRFLRKSGRRPPNPYSPWTGLIPVSRHVCLPPSHFVAPSTTPPPPPHSTSLKTQLCMRLGGPASTKKWFNTLT